MVALGIVLKSKGEILLIKRNKAEIGKGGVILKWALPGGSKKEGESLEETVAREVLEETGYKVAAVMLVSSRIHPQFGK